MADSIGRIDVPESVASVTFPFVTDFTHGRAVARRVIAHAFGDPRVEQRFYVGNPAARYAFARRTLSNAARATLAQFWRDTQGGVMSFLYAVPQEDQTFATTRVRFEEGPISFEDLAGAVCSAGVTFVEVPDPASAPAYTSAGASLTRFPDAPLAAALLDEVQEIVPLVRIRVVEAAVPDIFLSDRRVTIDGNLYQPRLLRVGEPGSDVLMSQSIDGSSDDVQFAFGNADLVMGEVANDTDLIGARIEFSLFHVGSLRRLDLWAGEVVDWNSDAGPEFVVRASDRLSALTLSSPVGTCSRACWRRYGQDGCPAMPGTQPLDLVHFPSADANTCDLGYETDNGCLAHSTAGHQTKASFGGVWAKPQQVRILDNSTGTWGIGRAAITPTSQINDSLWGQTLAEIWHNDDGIPQRALPVACRIAAGREESDFYIALGAVGRGPLGAFTVAQMVDTDGDGKKETFIGSTLDGQPHHGWKTDDNGNPTGNSYGLRQSPGADPATDCFSLSRVGSVPSSWREVTAGGSCLEDTYAAGVAFCEIRRVDEKGVQVSTVASHSMQALISQGLTARTWAAPGARVDAPGCTNVFWVAINTFLRAVGLADAAASDQEASFDAGAAIGAAATADAVVPAIFGGGTEAQFRFKGTVDTSKPTRDWLRDVLNNGLGYFTWSFGKLKIGCRNTATPVTTFHAGNMLFNSLRLEPVKPAFEKLTVEFADEEYLFAHNSVSYTDQDYAGRNNRVQNPRESQLGLVGSSTKSQCMRIAVCRAREELGGVGEAEQKAARNASWRSTILALDVEAGAVVSVIDPRLAGSRGTFRIQAWRLNRDWSVDLTGKTVRPSMYDLTMGPVPTAVTEAVQPIGSPRDSGAPPDPTFAARISLVDPSALEIYNLAFAQTGNTRTVTSATFTISFSGGIANRVETVNFPADFFASADASSWSLKVSAPGKTVSSVTGYVTSAFGNSGAYTVTVTLALANTALLTGAGIAGHAAVFDSGGKLADAGATPILFGGGSQTAGHLLAFDAGGKAVDGGAPSGSRVVGATFDGGGSALTAGLTAYVKIPFACTLAAWSILVDAGTCTIKVWKVASGAAIPATGDSISTSGVSISSGTAVRSTTLTDFTTTAFAAGDIVGIHLQAVTGATQAVFELEFTL